MDMSNVIGLDMGSVLVKGVLLREDGTIFRHMEKSGRNYRDAAQRVRDQLLVKASVKDAAVSAAGCGGPERKIFSGGGYPAGQRGAD